MSRTMTGRRGGDGAAGQPGRTTPITLAEAERLTQLLSLLADPTRARILFALGSIDELCVGDIALAVEVSVDAATYGLKMLRLAGLVRTRRAGRTVNYRLAEGFPHEMLEHCLRDLLRISPDPGGGR